jgi:acyl-CoA thioesterase-1
MTEANLSAMAGAAREAGAKVLLVGVQVPPNYGREYGERFASMYDKVADRNKTALVPFILKGVADGPDATGLFQADRIHPNEQAQPLLMANVWPALKKLLTTK